MPGLRRLDVRRHEARARPEAGVGAVSPEAHRQGEEAAQARGLAPAHRLARHRQREVESGWRHAKGADKAPLQEEFLRVGRILADTTCGVGGASGSR